MGDEDKQYDATPQKLERARMFEFTVCFLLRSIHFPAISLQELDIKSNSSPKP